MCFTSPAALWHTEVTQSKTLKSHQQPCKWKPSHAFSSVAEQRSASISMQIKWGYYVSVCRKKENGESEPSRLNFTFLPAIGEKREAGTFHKRSAETSRCIFKAEGAAALKNSSWHSHAAGRAFLRATLNDVFDEGTLLLLEKGSEAVTERSSTLRTNVSTQRWDADVSNQLLQLGSSLIAETHVSNSRT